MKFFFNKTLIFKKYFNKRFLYRRNNHLNNFILKFKKKKKKITFYHKKFSFQVGTIIANLRFLRSINAFSKFLKTGHIYLNSSCYLHKNSIASILDVITFSCIFKS